MLSRPLHDFYRLIEKIDTVTKEYLINRFAVKPNFFVQHSIETILENLAANPLVPVRHIWKVLFAPSPKIMADIELVHCSGCNKCVIC